MDGYLPRSGYYGELSSKFKFPGIQNQIFFVARYGQLKIDPSKDTFPNAWAEDNNLAELEDPETWDRSMTTLALAYNLTDYAKIRFEYYLLNEDTGDTKIRAGAENRNYQPDVDDDQMLIQLELSF